MLKDRSRPVCLIIRPPQSVVRFSFRLTFLIASRPLSAHHTDVWQGLNHKLHWSDKHPAVALRHQDIIRSRPFFKSRRRSQCSEEESVLVTLGQQRLSLVLTPWTTHTPAALPNQNPTSYPISFNLRCLKPSLFATRARYFGSCMNGNTPSPLSTNGVIDTSVHA